MANTENLNLPVVAASQAQKHVTVNDSLYALDAIVQLAVIDKDLTSPPGSPTVGDRYIVGSSATGDWAGEDGNIAAYQNSAWEFYTPQEGWFAYAKDEAIVYKYDGSNWVQYQPAETANGAATELYCVEEELTGLSGASVTTTIAFPNQCIILGASVRVTTAITGATSFDAGDGSTVNRFGGSLGISLGSTNQGTIGPAGNYASTTVTLTANGSNFTAGAVRVALHYMVNKAPTS